MATAMATAPKPSLIFGTATIGLSFPDASTTDSLLTTLQKSSSALPITHLDTGARYPPTSPGLSESLLGECKAEQRGFAIDTKIFTDAAGTGAGELTEGKIRESLEGSLKRLGVDAVETLYIHRADPETPVEETARAFDSLWRAGKFRYPIANAEFFHPLQLGISNMPLPQLTTYLTTCTTHSLLKPTYYQGDYNLITRAAETSLLPFLRAHSMRFRAYRPVAAGFLTGKPTAGATQGTRFDPSSPIGAAMGRLFGAPELGVAFAKLRDVCGRFGVGTLEAGLRWIFWHSALGEGDGVILGASRDEQVTLNVESVMKGPLPGEVVTVIEEVWRDLEDSRGGIV
ncbi:MAG: hypothetical protein M1828_007628 [Chrysothrix sp. TS-e1954]|nr:MAG: hypothetical protein M1828_007628 [Chrysothrix sp. TS-e1954]